MPTKRQDKERQEECRPRLEKEKNAPPPLAPAYAVMKSCIGRALWAAAMTNEKKASRKSHKILPMQKCAPQKNKAKGNDEQKKQKKRETKIQIQARLEAGRHTLPLSFFPFCSLVYTWELCSNIVTRGRRSLRGEEGEEAEEGEGRERKCAV